MNEGPYGEEYFREVYRDRLRPLSMAWWSVLFYQRLASRLISSGRDSSGTARVLELGCAHGFLLERLARRAAVVGLDVSSYALDAARRRVPAAELHLADLDAAWPHALEPGSFDLVVARYVFEHLAAPGAALRRSAALLKPGGALLFAVPDLDSPGRALKGDDWFGYRDATHVSLHDGARWLAWTREAGLSVERAFSDGLWDLPYDTRLPRALQYLRYSLPTIATVALARPLLRPGSGENLIVIARREHEGSTR